MNTILKPALLVMAICCFSVADMNVASGRVQTRKRSNYVVALGPKAKVKLDFTNIRKPFLSDRKYAIRKLPRGVKGSTLIVRNSGTSNNWLAGGQVVAEKDCTVFVAVQTARGAKSLVAAEHADKMKAAGWKEVKGFATTSPNKEPWTWTTYSKSVAKGPVKLANPAPSRTNHVFMFSK